MTDGRELGRLQAERDNAAEEAKWVRLLGEEVLVEAQEVARSIDERVRHTLEVEPPG